jgi:type II secretion system protein N
VKQILIAVAVFIVVFIVAFLLMFPLDELVKKQLDQQIAANQLPVKYSAVSAGVFSTKITGLLVNNIDAGTLTVKYSPLSLLTKSVRAELESPVGLAEARLKSGELTISITADLAQVGALTGKTLLGSATLEANYELETKKGEFNLSSGPLELQLPFQGSMMPVKFDSITGNGAIEDTTIFIATLEATGAVSATASGRITLEPQNIRRSSINMNVEASLYGARGRYAIRGSLFAPQVQMN